MGAEAGSGIVDIKQHSILLIPPRERLKNNIA